MSLPSPGPAARALLDWLRRIPAARLRRLGAEAAWTAAGMFVQLVGQVATLKVATALLAREDYGTLALLNSACALAQLLLLAPLVQGAFRQAQRAIAEGTYDQLMAVAGRLARAAWGIILLLALALAGRGLSDSSSSQLLLLVPAGLAMLYADWRSLLTQSLQHMTRARSLLAWQRIAENLARAGLVVLLLWWRPAVAFVPLAFAAATLATNAVFEPLTRRRAREQFRGVRGGFDPVASRREMLAFGIPIALGSVATWAQTSADRWFIERSGSLAEAGRYASASQLSAAPFGVLAGLLITFAGPILYARADLRDPTVARWLRRISWTYLGLGGAGLGLLVLLKRPLVHLLLGRPQWDCEPLLPLAAAGWMLFQWSQFPAVTLMVLGQTRRLLAPYVLAGLASAAANAVLVPRYGATGAAGALVISGAVRTAALGVAGWIALRAWLREVPPPAPPSS